MLPFANMSGDPEQEYFADGISEDIITGLSKLRWFFVIARNSSFTYKGKAVDVKRVARELGVRYVLEGSVRKGGNRVRITAQLIDAATGNHIWADRYDGDLTDVFALQDEITKKVVAAIEPKLLEAEGIRSQSRSPEDLGAWDMVIQANSLFWRLTKAESEAAIAMLKRAVERYPDYAPAHSMLAFMLLVSRLSRLELLKPQAQAGGGASRPGGGTRRQRPMGASRARLCGLHCGAAPTKRSRNSSAPSTSTRISPLPMAISAGRSRSMANRTRRSLILEQAIRMSPHDPQNAIFNVGLAAAHYLAGRYTEAVDCSRKASQQRSDSPQVIAFTARAWRRPGQIDEARAALARLQEMHPDNSIAWIEQHVPYTPGPMAKFLEGMRKAGLQVARSLSLVAS